MKDFYWDIRPKPEYGTVEVRIFDTPLTVGRAADLAAYVQTLAADLLERRDIRPDPSLYLVYSYNRFQACRFGFDAIVDPSTREQVSLADEIVATLETVLPHARTAGSAAAVERLMDATVARRNDARLLREILEREGSLADVVRESSGLWSSTRGAAPE